MGVEMNVMQLQQFLINKQAELSQEYRKVEVRSHISVTLNGSSVSEKFTAGNTPLNQTGREVTRTGFPVLENSLGTAENGTHVIFEVIPKGKRKPIRKDFYFLWDGES